MVAIRAEERPASMADVIALLEASTGVAIDHEMNMGHLVLDTRSEIRLRQ